MGRRGQGSAGGQAGRRAVAAALVLAAAVACSGSGAEAEPQAEQGQEGNPEGVPACQARPRFTPGEEVSGDGIDVLVAAPDLVVESLVGRCSEEQRTPGLVARVHNRGSAQVPGGLAVAFYRLQGQGPRARLGALLGVATVQQPLPAGAQVEVEVLLPVDTETQGPVRAVADDNGQGQGTVLECDEGNNVAEQALPLSCGGGEAGNLAPLARCRDVVLAAAERCPAEVSVDDGSYDPEGAVLQRSQAPRGPYGPGTHSVRLEVSDGRLASRCTATVTVVDEEAPRVGGDKSLMLLTADHGYRTVRLSECAEHAWDGCTGTLDLDAHGRIIRVISDEPEDAPGGEDGDTCEDMVRVSDSEMQLRAERRLGDGGRVYTVHYVVTDLGGNQAPGTCTVQVPPAPDSPDKEAGEPAYCVGEDCPPGTEGSPRCRSPEQPR